MAIIWRQVIAETHVISDGMLVRSEFSITTGWGLYTGVDTEGNSLLERTNIGNSVTQGFRSVSRIQHSGWRRCYTLRAFHVDGIF